MPTRPSKVLVIGSGPIVIGQAGSARLVHDRARALDLSQERSWPGAAVRAGGVGKRFQSVDGIVDHLDELPAGCNHTKARSVSASACRASASSNVEGCTGYPSSCAWSVSRFRSWPCSKGSGTPASLASFPRSWVRGGMQPVAPVTWPLSEFSSARWQKNTAYAYRRARSKTRPVSMSLATWSNQYAASRSIAGSMVQPEGGQR